MGVRTWIEGWPTYRQATGTDPFGRGAAVKSAASSRLTARIASADKVVKSVCPYGQNVYVTEDKAFACDIRPGRRPTGAARPALVRDYQERAGITEQTGTEP